MQAELHGFRNRRLHQAADLADQRGEIDHAHHKPALAGIGEQLPGEVGRTLGGAHHFLDQDAVGMVRRGSVEREAGIAQDSGEQVIEIVSHAAGQHAEALQLLRYGEAAPPFCAAR